MNVANQARFEDLFKRVMGTADCRPEYSMRELTVWDSLKHVELLTEIDETFGIRVEPTDLWEMISVAGISNVLSKYVD
jgi:acyl carrier protein